MRPGSVDKTGAYKRLLTTNSSDFGTFAARNATVTTPTTVTNPGLIKLTAEDVLEGATIPRWVEFIPFGTGANNATMQIVVNNPVDSQALGAYYGDQVPGSRL